MKEDPWEEQRAVPGVSRVPTMQAIWVAAVLLAVTAAAALASPNDFTGIGYLDEIQGISSKEGSVHVHSLAADRLIADDMFIANGVTADAGSDDHVVDTRGLVRFSAASLSIAAAGDLAMSSSDQNVRLAGDAATLRSDGVFTVRSVDALFSSQGNTVVRASETAALVGETFRAQAMSDIHMRSQGDAELSASNDVVLRGSTGAFSANGVSSIEVSEGNFDFRAGESLFVNTGGDTTFTAENGVQVHSDHNYVRITSFAGVAEFKGTNVDIDGQDGIAMDTLTEMVFEAGADFRVKSDEASFAAAAQTWTTELGNDINFSSSGVLRGVGGDVAVIGQDLVMQAAAGISMIVGDDTSLLFDSAVAIGQPTTPNLALDATIAVNVESKEGVTLEATIGDVVLETTDKSTASVLTLSSFEGFFIADDSILGDIEYLTDLNADFLAMNASTAVEVLAENDGLWVVGDDLFINVDDAVIEGREKLSMFGVNVTSTSDFFFVTSQSAITFTGNDTLDFTVPAFSIQAPRVLKQAVEEQLLYDVGREAVISAGFEFFMESDGTILADVEDDVDISVGDAEFISEELTLQYDVNFFIEATDSVTFDSTLDLFRMNTTDDIDITSRDRLQMDAEEDLLLISDSSIDIEVDESGFDNIYSITAVAQDGSFESTNDDVTITHNTGDVWGSGGASFKGSNETSVNVKGSFELIASIDPGDTLELLSTEESRYTVNDGSFVLRGGDILVDVNAELGVLVSGDITFEDLNMDTMDFSADGHRFDATTFGISHEAPITESKAENMLIDVISGDVNVRSTDEQPIEFFADRDFFLEGERGYQWSAPDGSMYIQVDRDGLWNSTGTMTMESSSRSSYSSDDDFHLTSTFTDETGIYMTSRQVNFFAKSEMLIETDGPADIVSLSSNDTITVGTTSVTYEADANWEVSAFDDVLVEADTTLVFETNTGNMTVLVPGDRMGDEGLLLEGGDITVTAEQQLALRSAQDVVLRTTEPDIGNENDHDLFIFTAADASGKAQDNWQLISNGVNAQSNLGVDIFVDDGGVLIVEHENLGVNIAGDDIAFLADIDVSFRAMEKITIDIPEGGFEWEAQSGYAGESYSVLIATVGNGAANASDILVTADAAEVRVAGSSSLTYRSRRSDVAFSGQRGMEFITNNGGLEIESTLGSVRAYMDTSVHIASGTNTDEGTSVGSISAGSFFVTADDRVRLHSLSRIAGSSKLGLEIVADDDVNFSATKSTKRIEIQPDGSAFFNSKSWSVDAVEDIQFKAENGAFSLDVNVLSDVQYNVGFVEITAGGLEGSVEFSGLENVTITSTTSSISMSALEQVNIQTSIGDIAIGAGTGSSVWQSDARTGGIAVSALSVTLETDRTIDMDGHQIDLDAQNTIDILTDRYQVGVSNTLFEPKVQFESSTFTVDSVGAIKISTEKESILIDSLDASYTSALSAVRMRTEKTALINGDESLSVNSVDAITIKGEILTEFSGDSLFASGSEVRVLAVTNVANNGISYVSSGGITFQSFGDDVRFSTTGLSTFTSSDTIDVEANTDISLYARRNFKMAADGSLSIGGSSTQLKTENRNGAKMEFDTNGEDSDIIIVPRELVLVEGVTGVELRGGNADVESEANFFVTAVEDIEMEGTGFMGFFADNVLDILAHDDILFESISADSEVEFFGFEGIRANAREDLRFETEALQKGDVLFVGDGNIKIDVGTYSDVDSDRDIRISSAGVNGDFLVDADQTTSVNTDGFIDVFVDESALVRGDIVDLISTAGRVRTYSNAGATIVEAPFVYWEADDGFRSVTHGALLGDEFELEGDFLFMNTSGSNADISLIGRAVVVEGFDGYSGTAQENVYITTTQRGADVIFASRDEVLSFFGANGVHATTSSTAHDAGYVTIDAFQEIAVTTTGEESEILVSAQDGDVSVTELAGSLAFITEDEFAVHATGTVELEARLGSDYSFNFESVESSIAFRTSDAGTGHISISATHGLVDVDAESVLIFNTEEGIDVRARNSVRLLGERKLGLAGILFEIEDSIHIQTLSDDVVFEGDEILFNVLSTGNLKMTSDGSETLDELVVRGRSLVDANVGSALISTEVSGDVRLLAECRGAAGAGCGMTVNSGDRVQIESQANMDVSASDVLITSEQNDIRIEAENGRVVLDSDIGQPNLIGNGPSDHGVWFTGGTNNDSIFLLPFRGVVLDGSGCPVEREFVLADRYDGAPGLCFCERGVWSCAYAF